MIRPAGSSAVPVGMSASLTGRYARFGRQALAGVQAWVADVNETGGVRPGPDAPAVPFVLHFYDDASRATDAARATHRLIVEDGVELLMGPYSSALTRAAADAAATHGVPLWNHGGAADDLYEAGNDWIIGVLSPASRYFAGLVALVHQTQPGAARLALIGVAGSPFARSVLAGGEAAALRAGFHVVLRADHSGAAGPEPVAAQLSTLGADLILVAGSFEQDVQLARAIAASRSVMATVGLVAGGVEAFGAELGEEASGFYAPSQWEPAVSVPVDLGPPTGTSVARIRSALGGPADYPAAQAYAAGLVAQHCLERAGSANPRAQRRAAGGLDIRTFYGRFRIDDAGRQVGHEVAIVRWRDGIKEVVWPTVQGSTR